MSVSRSHLISVQHPDCTLVSWKINRTHKEHLATETKWYGTYQHRCFCPKKHKDCIFLRILKMYHFEPSARRIKQFSQYQLLAEKIVTPVQHLVPIFNPYNQQKTSGHTKRKMEMMSESYLTCCINFCIKGGEKEILKIHSLLMSVVKSNKQSHSECFVFVWLQEQQII